MADSRCLTTSGRKIQFRRTRSAPAGTRLTPGVRRALYAQASFTCKRCAVCGAPAPYQLHHPDGYAREDLATLVPLCDRCHRAQTYIIGPAFQNWSRPLATLAHVTHGLALVEHVREFGPMSAQALKGLPAIHDQGTLFDGKVA